VSNRRTGLILIIAFAVICLVSAVIVIPIAVAPRIFSQIFNDIEEQIVPVSMEVTSEPIPTFTLEPQIVLPQVTQAPDQSLEVVGLEEVSLEELYDQVAPGVVNIQVYIESQGVVGEGEGSGFVLDREGHILTNNHVVSGARLVFVTFYDGLEVQAEVIGTDDDSDLAVIKVEQLPEDIHPLVLGDSGAVDVGEWVIAIGNPFGQQSSMTLGIVSAVGRTLPTDETLFSIPQAIQTDAAINPGNSGGPLLNMKGEVIGVNAQIASSGTGVNSGVGFAIPSSVVRLVAPVLIELGSYQWPWLGVEGTDVDWEIQTANGLESQEGAYLSNIVQLGPAQAAGLRGSSGTQQVEGLLTPVGGDVVIEADGNPIHTFADLLVTVAFKQPGDTLSLTILRDGQRQQVDVVLVPRP
jgi:S1-C subfamily serine protease